MRKLITFTLITILICMLCSCNSGEAEKVTPKLAVLDSSDYTFEITGDANNLENPNLTYTIKNSSTDKEISLGDTCSLEKEVNGKWEKVPVEATYFLTEYRIFPDNTFDGSCVVYDENHPLEKGKYRICKDVDVYTINTGPTEVEANVEGGTVTVYGHDKKSMNTLNIYAEFTVK